MGTDIHDVADTMLSRCDKCPVELGKADAELRLNTLKCGQCKPVAANMVWIHWL